VQGPTSDRTATGSHTASHPRVDAHGGDDPRPPSRAALPTVAASNGGDGRVAMRGDVANSGTAPREPSGRTRRFDKREQSR